MYINGLGSGWQYAVGYQRTGELNREWKANRGKAKRSHLAPIVWSNQREMLTMMRQFREAMALSAEDANRRYRHTMGQPSSGDPIEDVRAASEVMWYARSLSLADAYIDRLSRAIDERPQGKGGWQVASQLEKMYAEFAAHHDNPPPGMAVEVEPKTESQTEGT